MSTEAEGGEPQEIQLEPFITTPTGGQAPRCQRVKKGNSQCQKPARRGSRVCSSHGAGYRSREEAGERKKVGRPVSHGIYSATPTTDVSTLMAETVQLEGILENSDRDLLALKATLVYKLGELNRCGPAVDQVDTKLEQLEATVAELSPDPLSADDVMQIASAFGPMRATIREMGRLVSEVADISTRSINGHKVRAETAAKVAEQKGVRVFIQLCQVCRRIVHELARDDENLRESYELGLRRELFGPLRLEPPDVSTPPECI